MTRYSMKERWLRAFGDQFSLGDGFRYGGASFWGQVLLIAAQDPFWCLQDHSWSVQTLSWTLQGRSWTGWTARLPKGRLLRAQCGGLKVKIRGVPFTSWKLKERSWTFQEASWTLQGGSWKLQEGSWTLQEESWTLLGLPYEVPRASKMELREVGNRVWEAPRRGHFERKRFRSVQDEVGTAQSGRSSIRSSFSGGSELDGPRRELDHVRGKNLCINQSM